MTQLIIENNKLYNTTAIGLWIKSGSINDPLGKEGLHHFLEHIYFKDSKVQQAQSNLDRSGILYNAFTSHEVTCFLGQSTTGDVNKLMEFLLTINSSNLNISEEDLEKEKKVVVEEINYYISQPLEQLKHLTIKSILGINNPYTNSIYGTKKTVENIMMADIEEGINKFHSNKLIVVAGKSDYSMSNDVFPAFNKVDTPKITVGYNLENKTSLLWSKIIGKRDQCYYGIGILIPEAYKDISPAFLDSFHSTLNNEIREEKGLTYRILKNLTNISEGTVLLFLFQTSKKNLDELKISVNNLWETFVNNENLDESLAISLRILKKINFIKADNPIGEMKKIAYSHIFPPKNKDVGQITFSKWISAQELSEAILVNEDTNINEGYYVKSY
ncbi:M16 family metallopeptidase [Lysinibacillus sp. NPDC096418]|uniref:M16 family metallopeptidase n=1 Tax=Lysinibacillus sp. NPDC096418 TaxID=3364138 RepID=UPI003815BEB8